MVLMSSDNSLQLLDWLRELGLNVRVIDTEIASDLEGLCGVIKEVGDATGKLSVALERISELRQEILVLNQKFNLGEARPAVFLSLYGPALWTAGRKTFLNDIIIRAGASNIADFREGFFRLSIEDLIMRDPDIIIIPARNEEECADYQRGMFSLPGIYRLRAIRTGSLYCLKEENILRPSPRLLIALEELVNIIQN
jgi:iron complex transport system substrate-binding protein